MVKLKKLRTFFFFVHARFLAMTQGIFHFFSRNSYRIFTHGFFEEIFTQRIGLYAHFLETLSRKDLAFTHTNYKKIHVRAALFNVQKKHCPYLQGGKYRPNRKYTGKHHFY